VGLEMSGVSFIENSKVQFSVCLIKHHAKKIYGYRKVPGLGQKRNGGLTYVVLAAISFKIVSLGTYAVIPSFFPCFKSAMEVMFLNAVEYHL
jgi:hypothetical protein